MTRLYRGVPTHKTILDFMLGNPGKEFSSREIAETLYLSQATISQNAKFLVSKGKLTRRLVPGSHGTKFLYKLKE